MVRLCASNALKEQLERNVSQEEEEGKERPLTKLGRLIAPLLICNSSSGAEYMAQHAHTTAHGPRPWSSGSGERRYVSLFAPALPLPSFRIPPSPSVEEEVEGEGSGPNGRLFEPLPPFCLQCSSTLFPEEEEEEEEDPLSAHSQNIHGKDRGGGSHHRRRPLNCPSSRLQPDRGLGKERGVGKRLPSAKIMAEFFFPPSSEIEGDSRGGQGRRRSSLAPSVVQEARYSSSSSSV